MWQKEWLDSMNVGDFLTVARTGGTSRPLALVGINSYWLLNSPYQRKRSCFMAFDLHASFFQCDFAGQV